MVTRTGRMDKVEVQVQYLKERQDEIANQLNEINLKLDTIHLQMAELQGGFKMMKYLSGVIGAFAGGLIALLSHVKIW